MADKHPTVIPVRWPDTDRETSIRERFGLKAKMDMLLKYIKDRTGAEYTRNEFMIKSIKYYMKYVIDSAKDKELLDKMDEFDGRK